MVAPSSVSPSAMTSPAVSSYQDWTSEFRSLAERLKKIKRIPTRTASDDDQETSTITDSFSLFEFNKRASRIGLGIHETSQKIARLTKLAKRSSMFDDPAVEIQELTALIKNDITALNSAVSNLQTLQKLEVADGSCSNDTVVHANTICDDLKNKLMGTTKEFKDVLTTRTENLKAHENRKKIFSTGTSRENTFLHQSKALTEPPPWSNAFNSAGNLQPSVTPSNVVQSSNQLRRRLAADSTPTHHMEVSMLQQVVPHQNNYMQSRLVALQNVESTISELGGIFTQLASMVAQQGELAIRIDDNMDESLANVEGARGALLKHLNRISSNRWLLIKIFFILIFFLLVFIFFML